MRRRDRILALLVILVAAGLLVPWSPQGKAERLAGGVQNLKNLVTALGIYTTLSQGAFPSTLGQLQPNYIKTYPRALRQPRTPTLLATRA